MACNSSSSVTLNPWQNGTVGYDTTYMNSMNAELIKISSPLMYVRTVKRNITLHNIELKSFSEREYLESTGKVDQLYEEGEKVLRPGEYRVYGAFEIPTWAQELGNFGMTENEEVKVNFNISTLSDNLGGSAVHIGDVLKIYTSLYGWKHYEVVNALGNGNFLGQYLMWQVEAKKTDLYGYREETLDKAFDTIDHFAQPTAPVNITIDSGATTVPTAPVTPPPTPSKPKPKVY